MTKILDSKHIPKTSKQTRINQIMHNQGPNAGPTRHPKHQKADDRSTMTKILDTKHKAKTPKQTRINQIMDNQGPTFGPTRHPKNHKLTTETK